MGEPTVLFVKPQAISAKDKKALATAGVIVVEIDDPTAVKLVRPQATPPELEHGDLLFAAMTTISKSGDATKALFASTVAAAVIVRHEPPSTGGGA